MKNVAGKADIFGGISSMLDLMKVSVNNQIFGLQVKGDVFGFILYFCDG